MSRKQANNLKQADQSLRKTAEMNLISAANELSLPIHYMEILVVSTEHERLAAAGVLNCGHFHAGEKTDLLFLYLHAPGIPRDFYRVRIEALDHGDFSPSADLVNMAGETVKSARFVQIDPIGGLFGKEPAQKIFRPSIEGWLNRKNEYLLFGTLDAGKPFVIAISK